MGLLETFQRGALLAMNAAGNVPYICIFHHIGYDADGQASVGDAVTLPALRVIRMDYTVEKMDGTVITMNNRQYLAVSEDMGEVVPTKDDTLEFAANDVWIVQYVKHDPADATYLMHVRQ